MLLGRAGHLPRVVGIVNSQLLCGIEEAKNTDKNVW
jgi:hypothetical protein